MASGNNLIFLLLELIHSWFSLVLMTEHTSNYLIIYKDRNVFKNFFKTITQYSWLKRKVSNALNVACIDIVQCPESITKWH